MAFVTLKPVSLEFDDRVVRHQFFLGELSSIGDLVSEGDKQDATFDMRELGGNRVQFFAINFPTFVLRHQDFRIKLSELRSNISAPGIPSLPETPENRQTREDSIFARVPGFEDDLGGVSFQATNIGGAVGSTKADRFFIRHQDFHLFLQQEVPDPSKSSDKPDLHNFSQFNLDATFFIKEPLVQEGVPHVG